MLTAPYNFVPLPDSMVSPEWGRQVQMEVPFEHALSGSFDLVIEAVTPLIVGGKSLTPPKGNNAPADKLNFTLFEQPALPGTTLKGALRAVIEIASFGRITDRMDDRRFGVRDLQNAYLYTARFTEMFRSLTRAGWLEVDRATGGWMLRPCAYSLVRQVDLEKLHGGGVRLGRRGLRATDKYKAWGRRPLELMFDPDTVRARDDWAKGRTVSRADNVGRGRTKGRIVFTGQPANRSDRGAKQVEFLFHSPEPEWVAVPDEVRADFEHIHRNPNTQAPLPEWAEHRRSLLSGQPIPVFWLAADETDDNIAAMGLAMMFRLAYRHSTRQLARNALAKPDEGPPDFAETMFGYVRAFKQPKEDRALAGRVHIEPAALEQAQPDMPPREEILLSPKPGFYPAYVNQYHLQPRSKPPQVQTGHYVSDGKDRPFKSYTTYMDERATLRGWKRYPVSESLRPAPRSTRDQLAVKSREVVTRFTPWGAGTRFRTRVHVHNLRREELGALLWAICFGDPSKRYCHSIGMARPLGFGCVSVSVDPESIDIDDVDDDEHPWRGAGAVAQFDACRQIFVDYMNERVPGWTHSAQIRLLQAMADPTMGTRKAAAQELVAMVGPEPFQRAKRDGLVLPPYIEVEGVWPPPVPPPSPGGAPRTPQKSGSASRAAPAAPRTVRLDGMLCAVLQEEGNQIQVRFPNGDSEWVDASELDAE